MNNNSRLALLAALLSTTALSMAEAQTQTPPANARNNEQTISLDQIMATPIIRCDVPQWEMFGISLAGFNAIFSLAGAAFVLTLLRRRPTSAA